LWSSQGVGRGLQACNSLRPGTRWAESTITGTRPWGLDNRRDTHKLLSFMALGILGRPLSRHLDFLTRLGARPNMGTLTTL
jgi:hypothetical protein